QFRQTRQCHYSAPTSSTLKLFKKFYSLLFNILMVCLFWYILRYLLGFFQ
ncbi:hypothetical protein ACJX0J_040949, partial [Zea mays]